MQSFVIVPPHFEAQIMESIFGPGQWLALITECKKRESLVSGPAVAGNTNSKTMMRQSMLVSTRYDSLRKEAIQHRPVHADSHNTQQQAAMQHLSSNKSSCYIFC
jgi:hypothetical protein